MTQLTPGECYRIGSSAISWLKEKLGNLDFIVKVVAVDHAKDRTAFKLQRIVGVMDENALAVGTVKSFVEAMQGAQENEGAANFRYESRFLNWVNEGRVTRYRTPKFDWMPVRGN
ncbi:hypothetical protein GA0116948_1084 [Chitinophaga costaii]|uniref:Uncharacterized protein n=1 Tax=Chitinophaga costaii TaxID=1335309 RepID=A0A1C4EC29_9BACT|nr:hypothetical protein [Chitinophaga costaii]PUZ23918.1 hypothetical protein DCM91_14105 [Chitinophaga costaii]SCC41130.1 hypothetical protein GA0116948_1084 [Chitinophaga costaii]